MLTETSGPSLHLRLPCPEARWWREHHLALPSESSLCGGKYLPSGGHRRCSRFHGVAPRQHSPISQAKIHLPSTLPRTYDFPLQTHRISHPGEHQGSLNFALGPSSFGWAVYPVRGDHVVKGSLFKEMWMYLGCAGWRIYVHASGPLECGTE